MEDTKKKYKYHYVFYMLNELYGNYMEIDTAQDKFMLWCLEQKYFHSRHIITIKKVRITKEEWKRRYC